MKLTVGELRKIMKDLPDEYPVYVEHTDDTEDWVVVDGFRAVVAGPEDEGCLLVQAHVHYEDAEEDEDSDIEDSDVDDSDLHSDYGNRD